MLKYWIFGISVSFISWIIGMIMTYFLLKTKYYTKLSNLNFIKSRTWNKYLGIKQFKWLIKNTPFKFFNQKIKFNNKKSELTEIRAEMTLAEISHLFGFIFVTCIASYKCISHNVLFGLVIMIANVILNLYPSLLQQENKRRIDKILGRKLL